MNNDKYEEIYDFLLNATNEEEISAFLNKNEVKEFVLLSFSKRDFHTLLLDGNKMIMKYLFDEEGCNTLSFKASSNLIEERLDYLFNYSSIINDLVNNDYFCKMLLDRSNNLGQVFSFLSLENNRHFYDYLIKNIDNYRNNITHILFRTNEDEQLFIVKNSIFSNKDICYMLPCLKKNNCEWVLKNKIVDLTDMDYNRFMMLLENNVTIPVQLISNKLFNILTNKRDIFDSRKLINMMSKQNDSSLFEKMNKKNIDSEINGYNSYTGLTKKYDEVYNEIKNTDYQESINIIKRYFYDYQNDSNERLFSKVVSAKIDDLYGKINLLKEMKYICNQDLSDMIIDYHFEEYSYNVFLDLKELLSFQKSNHFLTNEKIDLYSKIMSIDRLSIEDKISFHNELKKYNIKEMFYDDMSFARKIMNDSISSKTLNEEKLKDFYNYKLSKEYGVDVYSFDGEDFFGIVKSGIPKNGKEAYARSYSLIGKYALGTFGEPEDGDTYLYEGLRGEQIVHVFPFDSFTNYDRENGSTDRVRVLMNPEELTHNTVDYNELLILERGNNKSDFDKFIPRLKRIALYCLDEIKKEDIEEAKRNNVGIMLVNSSKYKQYKNMKESQRIESKYDYIYFNESNFDDFERDRKKITKL